MKTIKFTLVILTVIVMLGVALVVGRGITGTWNPAEWGKSEDKPVEDNQNENNDNNTVSYLDGGMFVSSVSQEPKLSLAVTSVGENSVGENVYTLTANVTPSTAIDQNITFILAWSNPSSQWASGKNVNDYVSLEKTRKNSCVITCNAPFGEQVIVLAQSDYDNTITATATLDYVKRIEGIDFALAWNYGNSDLEYLDNLGNLYWVDIIHQNKLVYYSIEYIPIYSVGTLEGTLVVDDTITAILSDDFYNYLCNSEFYVNDETRTFANYIRKTSTTLLTGSSNDFCFGGGMQSFWNGKFIPNEVESLSSLNSNAYDYVKSVPTYTPHISLEVSYTYSYPIKGTEKVVNSGKTVLNSRISLRAGGMGVAPTNIELDENSFIF